VTRTRRRAASRPAGPPAGPTTDPAQSVTEAASAVLGSLGATPEHDGAGLDAGSSEPGSLDDDPEVPAVEDAPTVEHVPVKKKGSRKR
jgi:ribonuclease E